LNDGDSAGKEFLAVLGISLKTYAAMESLDEMIFCVD
jgi:hypothetical protein